jgi:hypothetical protein
MNLLLRTCAYSLICLGGVLGLHLVIDMTGDEFVWIWLTFTGLGAMTEGLVRSLLPTGLEPFNLFDYFEEPSE